MLLKPFGRRVWAGLMGCEPEKRSNDVAWVGFALFFRVKKQKCLILKKPN